MSRPWETLATVDTKEGPLQLRRRGERDFHITIAGRILMTSTAHRSEVALAEHGCAAAKETPAPRVLVSGLGMGFTLRAALDQLPADAHVTVAELTPAVVEWCRGPLGPLTNHAVDDPRVHVEVGDVTHVIRELAGSPKSPRYDAIILDMYVGPDPRVAPNDPFYGPGACARAATVLNPGGTFAVWGENKSPQLERNLEKHGFSWKMHRAGQGGRVHVIYVATKPARPARHA